MLLLRQGPGTLCRARTSLHCCNRRSPGFTRYLSKELDYTLSQENRLAIEDAGTLVFCAKHA